MYIYYQTSSYTKDVCVIIRLPTSCEECYIFHVGIYDESIKLLKFIQTRP